MLRQVFEILHLIRIFYASKAYLKYYLYLPYVFISVFQLSSSCHLKYRIILLCEFVLSHLEFLLFFFCLNSMEQTFCFFNSAFTYFTFVSFQDVLTHTFKSAIQLTVRERDFLLNQYRDNTMWFLRLYQNIINGRKERYFLLLGELFG